MMRVHAKQNRELYFSENLRPKMPLLNPGPFVASVLYCSIYHCTSFEKNEIEKSGILIFDDLFIRDIRIIPEGENMSIQFK